jgi:hypothetical protein
MNSTSTAFEQQMVKGQSSNAQQLEQQAAIPRTAIEHMKVQT